MPNKPTAMTLNASAIDILNTIRANAPYDYQSRVPEATQANLAQVGQSILQFQSTTNEFLSALVNRIGYVMITSKSYKNPLRQFKKGVLAYGESVEDIFVQIAKAHPFNPEVAEKEVFKREIPNVAAAFYKMNYQNFYKTTISNEQLRQAFLTNRGVVELIEGIIEQLYTGSEYDEYIIMKEMIETSANNGNLKVVSVPQINATNAKTLVTTIKGVSNQMEFMSTAYNQYGVLTHCPKSDQILLINASTDALIDVEVLASAFNMDKAEFMGRRVLVDDFGGLTGVYAALVDKNWFQVYDVNIGFTENYNGQGLYWNYFYHVWKIFAVSPFANAVIFSSQTVTPPTKIEVTPATANGKRGSLVYFKAAVTATDYTGKNVNWSLTPATSPSTINDGVVAISNQETNSTLTITATDDSGKVSGTATLTVTNPLTA